MPSTVNLPYRTDVTKVETDKEHVKGQTGGLNIMDLEVKLMLMSALPLLGVTKS